MLGTSIIAMIFSTIMHWIIRHNFSNRTQLLGISHIIASIALLSTLRLDEFSSIFVILPLTGFSFAAITDLPEQIANKLED